MFMMDMERGLEVGTSWCIYMHGQAVIFSLSFLSVIRWLIFVVQTTKLFFLINAMKILDAILIRQKVSSCSLKHLLNVNTIVTV